MHALTVCVDYSDILSLTLPLNRHHFDTHTIVTTPEDRENVLEVTYDYDVRVLATDIFYRDGAVFNKYRAIEWALDQMGRYVGWLCLLDADVVWPQQVDLLRFLRQGYLYTPLRRMCDPVPRREDGTPYVPPESEWKCYPLHMQLREWAGYSQIFHTSDQKLGSPLWHDIRWTHCGGGDSFLQAKWPAEYKIRPAWEVLHLDRAGVNWCGRATPRLDGSTPEDSVQKITKVRAFIRGRGNGASRFDGEKIRIPSERTQSMSEASGEGKSVVPPS